MSKCFINPFVPNAHFLYSLKTSENRKLTVLLSIFLKKKYINIFLKKLMTARGSALGNWQVSTNFTENVLNV